MIASTIDLLTSGGVLLFLDQWSKRVVRVHAADQGISCGPILRIRRVANLKEIYRRDDARVVFVLIWFTALACAILLHRSGAWFQSDVARLGLGLAFGGAAGNLLDILRWRYVVDFIDLGWWPVFNLADVGIVAGLVAAFWPRI
jgi:lipoprotein signal peptidase